MNVKIIYNTFMIKMYACYVWFFFLTHVISVYYVQPLYFYIMVKKCQKNVKIRSIKDQN